MNDALQQFDDWNWSDPLMEGDVTNDTQYGGLLDGMVDFASKATVLKRIWEGDYGQDPITSMDNAERNQASMLGAVERKQNLQDQGFMNASGVNMAYVIGAVGLAALLALAFKK